MFKPKPEPKQPTQPIPAGLTQTRRYDDVLMIAGQGPKPAGIAIVLTAPSEHEASDSLEVSETAVLKDRAKYLKGPAGIMLKDALESVKLDFRQMYVTSLIKWLLPKNKRYSPSAAEIALARDCLHQELDEAQPGLVIAFGKPAFEALVDVKISFNDIIGGVFWSERHKCRVMPLESPFMLEKRPDYIERYRVYLKLLTQLIGHDSKCPVTLVPRDYQTIHNKAELRAMVEMWKQHNLLLFAMDCEWKGGNHIDGELRSVQFCWAAGVARYVRFMDDQGNYVFDCSYAEAGAIMGEHLDKPVVQYVGHHISADLPWLHHVLGLKWFQKTFMDTEFAQQTADEHSPHGLEWLAVKDTDLGRYDIDLELYKKEHKIGKDEGYWQIPDSIMIPYGLMDADTTYRACWRIYKDLEIQGLLEYYTNILNPFCTDVFTNFVLLGLPMDIPKMDELRDLYGFCTDMMNREFQRMMRVEALEFLRKALTAIDPVRGDFTADEIDTAAKDGDQQEAIRTLGLFVPGDSPLYAECLALTEHFLIAPAFNIRSQPDLKRWLFDIKKFIPVKSTADKKNGSPSMSWEKIMTFSPERQKEYKPSTDRQSLQILSEQYNDNMLRYLLQLNAIGNIRKGLLKEPTIDDETGELTRENGLHYWLCQDKRIHGQLSLTETGRPRSWHPNTLNWSAFVLEQIEKGMFDLFTKLKAEQELPSRFEKYLDKSIQIPSIRSCVTAPPGWCLVESDFVTAEIRGLAYISGDKNLISLLNDPDQNFAKTKDGRYVRIGFDGTGISPEMQRPDFLLAYWDEGEFKVRYGFNDLERTAVGDFVYPRVDLHWSLAEGWQQRPREMMKKDTDRKAGKVGNFSCIPATSVITTDKGDKPLLAVQLTDRLWDGVAWVRHAGCVYKSEGLVFTYQGLEATVDHGVWNTDGQEMYFGDLIKRGMDLARGVSFDGQLLSVPHAGQAIPDEFDPEQEEYDLIAMGIPHRRTLLYDLVNAGPHHRFTANGVMVSNTAYGATAASIERKIEADTGVKPPPGTGEKILEALERRQPIAFQFLRSMEEVQFNPGYYRAASGRIRHYMTHPQWSKIGRRAADQLSSAQGREGRNFPMQESVGATAARACTWLLRAQIKAQMQSRIGICLYDSCDTWAPLKERFVQAALHEHYMTTVNTWEYEDRILQYPIETEFNIGWSARPSKPVRKLWDDPEFENDPKWNAQVLAFLGVPT